MTQKFCHFNKSVFTVYILAVLDHAHLSIATIKLHPLIEMTVSDRKVMLNYLIMLIYLNSYALKT